LSIISFIYHSNNMGKRAGKFRPPRHGQKKIKN